MTNPVALKNDTRLDDLKTALRDLGNTEAHGALSKPRMGLALCSAAYDRVITMDDVETCYNEYLEGRKAVFKRNGKIAPTDGSMKANLSKNRQLVALGLLGKVDGPALLEHVLALRTRLLGTDTDCKPAFDCMVDVARAQLANPDETLDDVTLESICARGETDKSDLKRMCDEYKRLHTLAKDIPSVTPSMEALGEAILAMDGELPPVTKEQKAAANFAKKAAAMGYARAA